MMANQISLEAGEFRTDWAKHHPGRQPLGWSMRTDRGLPWVRFHALPESKRYADFPAETSVILQRGNDLAAELIGIGTQCWLVFARCDGISAPGAFAGSWAEENGNPDGAVWSFFVSKTRWNAGGQDALLHEIADDGPYYAVWFDPLTGRVFAPYDGGFDLFPESLEIVAALRKLHPEWLPGRSDGL